MACCSADVKFRHGVYQANATSMFTNPEDTLNTWIQAYEAAATNLYDASQRKDVTAGGLAALLESILTNIAIGEPSYFTIGTAG